MSEVLAFNRWSTDGIVVDDPGLKRYITLDPKIVPKTGARYAGHRFHKSRTFIVERLMNKLMIPGHKGKKHFRSSDHCTGKAIHVFDTVEEAFEIIEKRTKENPVKVFVQAIVNAAPREELVSIEYGGARYPKAVDCAPQRRIDITLRYMVNGAFDRCFAKKKTLSEALADEIISAYRLDNKSAAIAKKLEIERQAESSR